MYKLDWEPSGAHWKYYGDVSGAEIIRASKEIYGDPRFDDLEFKLVDFLGAEAIQIHKNEVAEIACQHKVAAISNPNVKTAIVMKKSDNEMAIFFASFFEDSSWDVRIFQDINEANKWLGRI